MWCAKYLRAAKYPLLDADKARHRAVAKIPTAAPLGVAK
jgi:hypothetical protein